MADPRTADFDHTDPVAAQDIYGLLSSERERCPVLRGSAHGGFWALSRFADVTGAANDHEHSDFDQPIERGPIARSHGRVSSRMRDALRIQSAELSVPTP